MRQQVIKHKNIKKEMSLSLYLKIKKYGSSEEEKNIMKKKIATILTAAVIGATAFT